MGKSYKKSPVCKDNNHAKKRMKQLANKKVRKTNNVPNGNSYKKNFCSYDIVDYRFYRSYESFKGSRNIWGTELTKDDWERWYKRK